MEDICSVKIIPIREGSTELHMHENQVLFLCGAPAFFLGQV